MRENRTYGSEGGAAETNRPSLPLNPLDPLLPLPLLQSLKLLEHGLVPGAAAAFDVGLIQSARYGRQVRMLVQNSFTLLAKFLGSLQQPQLFVGR